MISFPRRYNVTAFSCIKIGSYSFLKSNFLFIVFTIRLLFFFLLLWDNYAFHFNVIC